jgi:hypothetical protein
MKDMIAWGLRTEIVWVFYLKIYQMLDSVWASPFVTIVTYRNTFDVIFPTFDKKAGGDAIALCVFSKKN